MTVGFGARSLALIIAGTALWTGPAQAQKCENPNWNYCGQSIDKCCPPERPFACVDLMSPMQGAVTPGGPQQTVPRGWSGCVMPGTMFREGVWASNCRSWVRCNDQD